MGTANCIHCDNLLTFDVIPRRGKVCFKCHIGTVTFGFQGGKEEFHGDTLSQRRQEIEHTAKVEGREIEPVGKRWV